MNSFSCGFTKCKKCGATGKACSLGIVNGVCRKCRGGYKVIWEQL